MELTRTQAMELLKKYNKSSQDYRAGVCTSSRRFARSKIGYFLFYSVYRRTCRK